MNFNNKLSVVIITFNEEKNIGRCLENIKDIADEIIVVDSFSTDSTENICHSFGVKFLQNPFKGFSNQKEYACKQTRHEYILSIDADEILDNELKCNILLLKEKGFTKDAYLMKRCTNFCGHWIKHGIWYPDKQLGLYNKNKGEWGGVEPHGLIIMQPNTSIENLGGDILHYSYDSMEDVINRNNKYTSTMALALYNRGKRCNFIKLVLSPMWAFVNGYVLKLGFLDGIDGFFIASSVAYQTMVKYAKLHKLQKNK